MKELFPSIADRIKLEDIDVSHPLPTKGTKSCVIVKFVRRDIKNLVFFEKKNLKNSPLKLSITEHLTARNLWYLDEARKIVGFKNAWSSQCVVYALVNQKKVAIRSSKDLNYVFNASKKSNYQTETTSNPSTVAKGSPSLPSSPQEAAKESIIETIKTMNADHAARESTNSNSISTASNS